MMIQRKICVITCARSDYGLLTNIIREIDDDLDLTLQLLVTGMHLSYEYGHTIDRIREDGFEIADTVEVTLSSNTAVGMSKSAGLALISFADSFSRLKPDIIVLLGDRFEIFAAAACANMMNIPIAHIHGGELTYGAIDDSMRHAITKLSQIHFPVAEIYKNRILQMGEIDENVFNFGAPGLDYLDQHEFISREQLENNLGIKFTKQNFLITFHSVTRDDQSITHDVKRLLEALDHFQDTVMIFTEANADAGGQVINSQIRDYCNQYPGRVYLFKELGLPHYLSIAKQVGVVIGNSSSGVIEIPCIGKATVNIGSRQDGRLRANSIIDVPLEKMAIISGINKALTEEVQEKAKNSVIPFKQKNTSIRIKEVLKSIVLDNLCRKRFIDYV
jgi:UDP-hydrolysing UDP-N-acetyl-D-glucosamine 2-epimerase